MSQTEVSMNLARGLLGVVRLLVVLVVVAGPQEAAADDSVICTDPVCYFEWEIRWDRVLTYREGRNTYNVEFDSSDRKLYVIPNIYRYVQPTS